MGLPHASWDALKMIFAGRQHIGPSMIRTMPGGILWAQQSWPFWSNMVGHHINIQHPSCPSETQHAWYAWLWSNDFRTRNSQVLPVFLFPCKNQRSFHHSHNGSTEIPSGNLSVHQIPSIIALKHGKAHRMTGFPSLQQMLNQGSPKILPINIT